MKLLTALFSSSIGRKILMAVTGVILTGFIIGHLVGNLQIFSDPDKINGYAHVLRELGPALWTARIILLISVVIHIWAATVLTIENRRARGSEPYGVKTWIAASLSSRFVRWTGYIVLVFILYHLAQFTFGAVEKKHFKDNLPPYILTSDYHVLGLSAVKAGTKVPDVHSMMIFGFQNVPISIFYIVAVGLLSFHLQHGLDSLFQTLGLRNGSWSTGLRKLVTIFCVAYFIGNLLIPVSILAGYIKLRPEAAQLASQAVAQR
ncbi:MAG TPA: succinate dehydrogenase cytochrome b subunit [Opitutaceae bacterium]|nr:succinate dehydrogenase cytochrome b subunit [Opitutaceae bacterium]